MKKTLALIFSLVFIFCMLPMNVFAAKEMFIAINEVTVNEIPSPAAGTEVQFSAKCLTQYVSINAIKWHEKKTESVSGTALTTGAKFKPGYYYTVSVELKISNNAYYFAGNGADVAATINGKTAATSNNSAAIMSVSYTFPMCLTTVSKFEFNLAAPIAGAAPYYPLLTGTGYESNNRGNNGLALQNGIYWRNETDNKVLYPDENPKFEAGKTYSANITVATTTGYRVSTSYTVKVNGKTVTSTKVDNECITFKVEFKIPKAHAHTDSEWKTDTENHWKECTDQSCGAVTVAKEAHKDSNKDNTCDVCGYAIPKDENPTTSTPNTQATTDRPETDTTTDTKPSENIGNDQDSEETTDAVGEQGDGENGNWLWIVIAIVVVLGVGAVVAVVLIKKKK